MYDARPQDDGEYVSAKRYCRTSLKSTFTFLSAVRSQKCISTSIADSQAVQKFSDSSAYKPRAGMVPTQPADGASGSAAESKNAHQNEKSGHMAALFSDTAYRLVRCASRIFLPVRYRRGYLLGRTALVNVRIRLFAPDAVDLSGLSNHIAGGHGSTDGAGDC